MCLCVSYAISITYQPCLLISNACCLLAVCKEAKAKGSLPQKQSYSVNSQPKLYT